MTGSDKKAPPIKRKSADVRPREYLTVEEVDALGEAALTSRNALRDSLLVLLCYRHALAVRELIALKWENFDWERKTLSLIRDRSAMRTEHLLGDDEILLLGSLREKNPGSKLVFTSERKTALDARSIGAIVSQAGRKAGLPFSVNPSLLRHSKGLQLAQQGYESETIRAYLGQKTSGRSRQYVQLGRSVEMEQEPGQACADDVSVGKIKSWRNNLLAGKALTLRIPLSTCNLGPGLDALGLALNLYTHVSLRLVDDSAAFGSGLVSVQGDFSRKSAGADIGDLIYTILNKVWKSDRGLLNRMRLAVHCDLPLGCGLGTAGTAILGAVWAAHMAQDDLPSKADLLAECCSTEGHLETMAASLLGSLVVCSGGSGGERILAQPLHWPSDWLAIAVVPPYTLTSKQSRRLLPAKVALSDAIANIRNTASVVTAVVNSDAQAMKEALRDRLHERARADIVPELAALKKLLEDAPVLGCVLSGGGPSVLILVQELHKEPVLERLQHWNLGQDSRYSILDLRVDSQGMTVID